MQTMLCHLVSGVKKRPWPVLFISVDVAFVCFPPYLEATYVFGDVASLFKSHLYLFSHSFCNIFPIIMFNI